MDRTRLIPPHRNTALSPSFVCCSSGLSSILMRCSQTYKAHSTILGKEKKTCCFLSHSNHSTFGIWPSIIKDIFRHTRTQKIHPPKTFPETPQICPLISISTWFTAVSSLCLWSCPIPLLFSPICSWSDLFERQTSSFTF